MRLYAILFCVALFVPIYSTSAQIGGDISDITGENVSIILDPQYPNPGDRVTATIDDYSLNSSGSTITWYFDGLSAPNVNNTRSVSFTAPKIGNSMEIIGRLTFSDGRKIEAKKTLNPLYLDLIVEPQTYTPIFYKGKALPTKGSVVNINALLQSASGPVNPASYTYNWTLNNKSVYGGARVGGNWAQIEVPHGRSNIITISVQNSAGTVVARKVVAIPTADLEVQFYEQSTLLGLHHRALIQETVMTGNSMTIKAVPYYLDTRSIGDNLFTQWSVNNLPVMNNSSGDPFELNLERGTTGSAQVGFKIHNLTELLQSDEGFFEIKL